jgi:cbb3-type cytochrome c oxidase subunit III
MISTGRTARALGTRARALRSVRLIVVAAFALALAPLASAENERGEALFDLCSQCHGEQGEGKELFLAPSIAGMGEWYVTSQLQMFQSGNRGLHHQDIGGMRMVPMSRYLSSDADLKAVAAYVASLPKSQPTAVVQGDAAKGQAAYALCASCHGPEGKGNQQMNAPRLVGTSDWYLLSSLQKYKDGIRGSNTANANSMMMRGMAMSLADDQAMKDVVAHINTLAK